MSTTKISVGILGATGVVGQRLVQLLEHHPWFELSWLAASERSQGQLYADIVRWRLRSPIPPEVAETTIAAPDPVSAPRVIFSALDADIAHALEPRFADAGCAVVSNSSAFRMDEKVPLVIPEVNADHLRLLECQQTRRRSGGFIVTNPNCSATGLVMALAPLAKRFGIEKVSAVTMQAISGAGYPGVASLDILGNVIPHITREEEKLETEPLKLLGALGDKGIAPAKFAISAQCNRVPVEDGHTESVSVKLAKLVSREALIEALNTFRGVPQELRLPSAPERPLIFLEQPDRPQPALDVNCSGGMTVTVGRVRPCNLLDWKFTVLSHNTIRGAAGAALLNAELLKAQGYLQ